MDKTCEQVNEAGLKYFQVMKNILDNKTTIQTIKQSSLASSLFVIVVRLDVSLYVQFLIKFTTVTTAKPLQSHFTLVK